MKLEITGSAAGRGSSRSPSCQIRSTQLFPAYHPGDEDDKGDASCGHGGGSKGGTENVHSLAILFKCMASLTSETHGSHFIFGF